MCASHYNCDIPIVPDAFVKPLVREVNRTWVLDENE